MRHESFYTDKQNSNLSVNLIGIVTAQCSENQKDNIQDLLTSKLIAGELSLFRGLSGDGFICTGEKHFELHERSLFVIPTHEITTVAPNSANWSFAQYRFTTNQPMKFIEIKQKYALVVNKEEELLVKEIFCHQYANANLSAGLISALFLEQLYRWGMELESAVKSKNMYEQKIQFAIEYINLHLNEQLSISELSQKFSISERHFRNMFHQVTGKSPKSYLQEVRLNKAAHLLGTELNIQEISEELGYYSQYQFSRDFKKFFGVAPTDYRKGNFN